MDFSTRSLKNFVSDVTTVFTRAKQYAEETIGTAERTELDQEYEALAERADSYKQWTERIVAKLEAIIQPNPNMRYGDMLIERMGTEIKRDRLRNLEYLGNDMIEAGIAFGPSTLYGNCLVKVGKHQTSLGQAEKTFVQNTYRTIIIPLRKFLDEDMKTIAKERKFLETKRLDLDAAKNRLRKAKSQDSQNNAERDLNNCQKEFDRQIEITKLLLEGISSAQANHVRCLNDFVVHQNEYYNQCYRYTMDLQRELSLPLMNGNVNIGQSNQQPNDSSVTDTSSSRNQPMKPTELHAAASAAIYDNNLNTINNKTELNHNQINNNKRQAKCLNDYQAQTDNELSLIANEIINVSMDNTNTDTDWMIGQRSNGQTGKVPVAYLEILN